MWKRLFPKGFLQAAQTKQVVCHVCLRACITSWGQEPQLSMQWSRAEKEPGPFFPPGPSCCWSIPLVSRAGELRKLALDVPRKDPGVAEKGFLLMQHLWGARFFLCLQKL